MLRAMTEPDRPLSPAAPQAPRLLARLAQAAIAVAAVAEVFRAVTLRAHRLHPEETPLSRSGLVSMASVYAVTLAAILFLMWFHRCRSNARLISPGADLGSDLWAVVAWLVPLVNLWVPRGLLLGTQRASGARKMDKGRDDALVNAWWLAWAAHVVIATVGRSSASLPLLAVTQVLNITAAVLAVCVVQRITSLQSGALGAERAVLQEA